MEDILKIFARSIMNREEEKDDSNGEEDNNNSKEEEEAEEDTKKKTEKKRKATVETLATIADNFNNILAFLQAVAVKSPWVIATPLSLRTNKQARVWFFWWYNINLPASPKTSP